MGSRTPEQLARHAAIMRQRRADGLVHDQEWRKAWREANPETVRETNRKASRKYAESNPDKEAARRARFKAENPTYWSDRRDEGREYENKWRTGKAGVILRIRAFADECGVCSEALHPDLRHPDPLSTTIGHEPPLSVAAREGWLVVTERYEHLRCNLRKGTRMDCEMRGHAAAS